MLYLIKFIYTTFILPPGIFIVLLLLLAFKVHAKRFRIALSLYVFTFIFYLFTTPLIGNMLIGSLERQYSPVLPSKGDVIILLGGGATLDTPNIGGKGHLSGHAANRLLTALQIYQKKHLPILVSGGKVYKDTGREADITRNIMLSLGIPEKDIILENKSLNTKENAEFSKRILDKKGFSSPILVTSAFHMPRAVRHFESYGIRVTPFPTDYCTNMSRKITLNKFIPSADALNNVSLALKEYLGILAVTRKSVS